MKVNSEVNEKANREANDELTVKLKSLSFLFVFEIWRERVKPRKSGGFPPTPTQFIPYLYPGTSFLIWSTRGIPGRTSETADPVQFRNHLTMLDHFRMAVLVGGAWGKGLGWLVNIVGPDTEGALRGMELPGSFDVCLVVVDKYFGDVSEVQKATSAIVELADPTSATGKRVVQRVFQGQMPTKNWFKNTFAYFYGISRLFDDIGVEYIAHIDDDIELLRPVPKSNYFLTWSASPFQADHSCRDIFFYFFIFLF